MPTPDQTRIEGKIDHVAEQVSLLNKLLTGGDEPARGMIVRIDRVEQTQERQRKVIWAVVGAVLAQAVNMIKDMVL